MRVNYAIKEKILITDYKTLKIGDRVEIENVPEMWSSGCPNIIEPTTKDNIQPYGPIYPFRGVIKDLHENNNGLHANIGGYGFYMEPEAKMIVNKLLVH